jgi:hypothetical protein
MDGCDAQRLARITMRLNDIITTLNSGTQRHILISTFGEFNGVAIHVTDMCASSIQAPLIFHLLDIVLDAIHDLSLPRKSVATMNFLEHFFYYPSRLNLSDWKQFLFSCIDSTRQPRCARDNGALKHGGKLYDFFSH